MTRLTCFGLALAAICALASAGCSPGSQPVAYVYAGVYVFNNYTDWTRVGGGIAAYRLNADGTLFAAGGILQTPHDGPCALVVTPGGQALYVGDFNHYFYGYTIGANGALTYAESCAGSPEYTPYSSLVCDESGQHLYVAEQYGSGTGRVAIYEIDPAQAAITSGPATVAAGSWPEGIAIKNGHVYVANNGSSSISIYHIGADGGLTAETPYNFVGFRPSFLVAHPTLNYLYLSDPTNKQVTVLTVNADGTLGNLQITPDSDDQQPMYIEVDPRGRFVFTANFGSNTVSVYTIGSEGSLTFYDSYVCANPYHPAVDPTGSFLLVPQKAQKFEDHTPTHAISVFRIDQTTGALSLASKKDLGAGNEPNYLIAVAPPSL